MKRTIKRVWGQRRDGGWVMLNSELLKVLAEGDAAEFDSITVGAKQLRDLIKLLPYEDCLVKTNGRLEIETIERVGGKRPDGTWRSSFYKPKHGHHWFGLVNGAWLPRKAELKVVVIKPKKF